MNTVVFLVALLLAYFYLLEHEKQPNRSILSVVAGALAIIHWLAAVMVIGSILVVIFLKSKDKYENR